MTKYTNEDFFKVIGQISIFFATLDFITSLLIKELVKDTIQKRPEIEDTLGKKLRFLHNLKDDEVNSISTLIELRKIIDNAIALSNERNRYIHDQWEFKEINIKNGVIRRLQLKSSPDNNIKVASVSLTLDELCDFKGQIGNMQTLINDLYLKAKNEKTL